MFTPDDFWRILRVLKDSTDIDPALDLNTKMLAESEQQTSTQFFLGTIDQVAHLSDDYKRLRTFLIDWYSAHKTITSTQKHISDVYSLPSEHVDELIKSFGFNYGLNLVPLRNRVNMFLDLVNLYKKKGTPEALADILDYFGFSDADIVEYWLQKNSTGQLIFKGHLVRRSAKGSTALLEEDISFYEMTHLDPHWLLTESQTEALIAQNKVNLPSKSAYFSLSSLFSMYKLEAVIAIVSRIIQDQYVRKIINGLDLPSDIQIKGNIGNDVSLLEIYTAIIYVFERMFGTNPTSDLSFFCYNGTVDYNADDPPSPINLNTIVVEYEDLMSGPPSDRDDRKTKLSTYISNWTRLLTTNIFDTGAGAAETILTSINPGLKDECDSWFLQNEEDYLISYLIGTLDQWIRSSIDSQTPSLVVTILGFGFRKEVSKIINFFKPYRAKLAFLDISYPLKNPLAESVRLDDTEEVDVYQSHIDQLEFLDTFIIPYMDLSFTDFATGVCFHSSYYTKYDIGSYYDEILYYCDFLDIIYESDFEDTISTSDVFYFSEDKEFSDWPRGTHPTEFWDTGGYFDVPVQAPIVTDHDNLDIIATPPY